MVSAHINFLHSTSFQAYVSLNRVRTQFVGTMPYRTLFVGTMSYSLFEDRLFEKAFINNIVV